MELIAAILFAGPLGYFVQTRTRVRGIAIYLVLWALIFPIQTAVVHAENADDIVPSYFIVNAVILAVRHRPEHGRRAAARAAAHRVAMTSSAASGVWLGCCPCERRSLSCWGSSIRSSRPRSAPGAR